MPLEDFVTWTFCWIDDEVNALLQGKRLRQRGFSPKLSDSEVITMEVVGEFLGIDTNTGIWSFFKTHWLKSFPTIGSRSQFAKQAANLCWLKQRLQKRLSDASHNDSVHIIDGFPIPISHFKRAKGCKRFRGEASYGYCASKSEHYYGFKGHLLITLDGSIAGFTFSAAHESEREAVWELMGDRKGLLLGDKGYLGADFQRELKSRGVELVTPVRSNMSDSINKPWRNTLNRLRRRVETTIGQLVERFNIEKVRARNLWSLSNRFNRKLLSHGLGVLANREAGLEPLQLAAVIN